MIQLLRTATPLIAAAALLLVPLAASGNSEFEGEWKLDLEKSRGDLGELTAATQLITLEGKNLKVSRHVERGAEEPQDFEYVYLTSGDLHKVVGPGEFEREVTAKWKGKELVVKWTLLFNEIEIPTVETWKKRRSGLEMKRVFSTPIGDREVRMFFVRP